MKLRMFKLIFIIFVVVIHESSCRRRNRFKPFSASSGPDNLSCNNLENMRTFEIPDDWDADQAKKGLHIPLIQTDSSILSETDDSEPGKSISGAEEVCITVKVPQGTDAKLKVKYTNKEEFTLESANGKLLGKSKVVHVGTDKSYVLIACCTSKKTLTWFVLSKKRELSTTEREKVKKKITAIGIGFDPPKMNDSQIKTPSFVQVVPCT